MRCQPGSGSFSRSVREVMMAKINQVPEEMLHFATGFFIPGYKAWIVLIMAIKMASQLQSSFCLELEPSFRVWN
jgi:hypothetical protein